MAFLGFSTASETLPLINGTLSDQQLVGVLNDIITRINKIQSTLDALTKTQILKDETGTGRMLQGYQENGWGPGKSFGVKISVPGVEVLQATDSQLLFKNDMDTWLWYDGSGVAHTLVGRDVGGF